MRGFREIAGQDSNLRPSGYESVDRDFSADGVLVAQRQRRAVRPKRLITAAISWFKYLPLQP
jgi:hypothetical protein